MGSIWGRYSGVLALTCVAIAFSACSTLSKSREQNLYQVHVGQSQSDLLVALGEPDQRISTDGHGEKWFYEIYAADNRETYPYTATFEKGNLTKWEFDTARNSLASKSPRGPASVHQPFQY